LRWYFSPYLTTLLTAPIFAVLAVEAVWYGVRALILYWHVFKAFGLLILFFGPVGVPLVGIACGIMIWCISALPAIWYKPWNGAVRCLAVLGAIIGCHFLADLVHGISSLIVAELVGYWV